MIDRDRIPAFTIHILFIVPSHFPSLRALESIGHEYTRCERLLIAEGNGDGLFGPGLSLGGYDLPDAYLRFLPSLSPRRILLAARTQDLRLSKSSRSRVLMKS